MLFWSTHINVPLKYLNDQIHQELNPKKRKDIRGIILHVSFGLIGYFIIIFIINTYV
jgi:hypothetical protein